MNSFDIEKLIIEWSYRVDRGYPIIGKPEDLKVLREVLEEYYGYEFAREYTKRIRESINEVSLGLNNSSLRHENEHRKYNKRLINIFRSGGEVKIENKVEYVDESEDTNSVTIPKGVKVKVDSEDEIIGKLVASLRGLYKHGPEFPEGDEEARKALERAERVFTHGDGSYKRNIPIIYKGNKVLVKLNDLSKDSVTDEDEGQDSDIPSDKEKSNKKKKKKSKKKVKNEQESIDSIISHLSKLSYQNSEELESNYHQNVSEDAESDDAEKDTDKPSKYADRRDDGKDDKYPDREYKEYPEDEEADGDEEADSDEENSEEENEEENVEEASEINRTKFKVNL